MFKQHWRIFAVGLSLALSATVIAQNGPLEHADPKKAEQTAGDDREQAETRNERAESEAERTQEEAEKRAERAEREAERARERAEQGRELGEKERNSDDRQNKRQDGDMPPGLEGKDTAPQSGKGSDKGREKREEKSSAWWKFWD